MPLYLLKMLQLTVQQLPILWNKRFQNFHSKLKFRMPLYQQIPNIKIKLFFNFLIGTTMSASRPVALAIIPVSLVAIIPLPPAYPVNRTISVYIHRSITPVHVLWDFTTMVHMKHVNLAIILVLPATGIRLMIVSAVQHRMTELSHLLTAIVRVRMIYMI